MFEVIKKENELINMYPFQKENERDNNNSFLASLQAAVRTDEEYAKFKGYIK